MEVIHRRCSGLDVHKETVVACVGLALDGKITRIEALGDDSVLTELEHLIDT
jgi:hypothetical protein